VATLKAHQPGYGQGVVSLAEIELLTREELQGRLLEVFRDPAYVPPVLPKVAIELLALSRRSDINIRDIVALLEQDALIAAKVLKRSQSALYSRGAPIRSLHEAVVRLGLGTIHDLFLAAALEVRVFRAQGYDEPMERLRRHSTAAAHVARLVCRQTAIYDEYAFLCGLLHDAGMVASLIALASGTRHGERPADLSIVWDAVCDAHEAAGETLCRLWGLPGDIAIVVASHHGPRANQPVHPLAAAIAVAESILLDLGFGLPGDGGVGPARWATDALDLSEPVLASLTVQAKHILAPMVVGADSDTSDAKTNRHSRPPLEAGRPLVEESSVPPATARIWQDILTMRATYSFEFLPYKLALGRLVARVQNDPSALFDAARELRKLFVETARVPAARRDLAKIRSAVSP
jgi:HD-like signal output (HDOD) protein